MARRKNRKTKPKPKAELKAEPKAESKIEPEAQLEAAPQAEAETEPDSGNGTVPLDQYQRLLAEFDNFRKRVNRERERIGLWARADLLKALLPTLDDFDRARDSLPPEETSFDKEGILIIVDRFAELLNREGLRQVKASPRDVFDPEIHEAVLTVPSAEISAGRVAEVLEKGYQVGERLLRPAKVAVTRSPDAEPAAKGG